MKKRRVIVSHEASWRPVAQVEQTPTDKRHNNADEEKVR
jgi:hypothetical protein